MKKKILSIALSALMLTSTACSDKKENTKTNRDTSPVFMAYNRVHYNNGVVFGNDTAYFLDFDTMEKAPLCAVPNCTHDNAGCLAEIVGRVPVFYKEHIYYFTSNNGEVRTTAEGNEFFIESKLWRVSLESSEAEIVCEFTDCAPTPANNGYPGYVLYGNELYFTGDDLCPTETIEGLFGWGTSGGYHYLCSINLDTGENTNHGSIYDGDKQYEGAQYSSGGDISGVYKDTMYIEYAFKKEVHPEGTPVEVRASSFTFMNFEFDFETKTWKESSLPFSRYMNDDTYTYYDFDKKQLHVLHKDNELIIDSEEEISQMSEYGGKLFLHDKGVWYDLSDNSEHSMGKYSGYEAVGYHEGCYILIKGGRNVKLTEEELRAL